MNEEFVRKDVFEANMRRIDQHFDATERLVNNTVERMEAIIDRNLAKHDAVAAEMRGDIRALNTRIDSMEGKLSQSITITSVIVTVFGIIITIVIAAIQFWK